MLVPADLVYLVFICFVIRSPLSQMHWREERRDGLLGWSVLALMKEWLAHLDLRISISI